MAERAALRADDARMRASLAAAKRREDIRDPEHEAKSAEFSALKDAVKNGGVVAVAAPNLFPTPSDVAARMADLAGMDDASYVLEPSAGTGSIWRELIGKRVAVEINPMLAEGRAPGGHLRGRPQAERATKAAVLALGAASSGHVRWNKRAGSANGDRCVTGGTTRFGKGDRYVERDSQQATGETAARVDVRGTRPTNTSA